MISRGLVAVAGGLVFLAGAFLACSSDSTSAPGASTNKDGGSSGTSGSSSGTSGATGTSGGTTIDDTLIGTWDVIATSYDQSQSTGHFGITPTALYIDIKRTKIEYDVTGNDATLVYTERESVSNLRVGRDTKTFSTGALGFPVGGDWVLSEPTSDGECDVTVGADSTAKCHDVTFPKPFRNPRQDQTYTGKRTKTADSIFGDLGGDWTFATQQGVNACAASIAGRTVHLQCTGADEGTNGAVDLTFGADFKTVSGHTSGDFELAGQKTQ